MLVGNNLGALHTKIGNIFGSNLAETIFLPVMFEEIEFRWLLQKIVMRKIPQALLEKISPDLSDLIDSMPVRITGVSVAALLFALCHHYLLECDQRGGMGL